MLVLSRKKGQQLAIRGPVLLTVLDVKGGTIRLGIESQSAEGSPVFRGEIAIEAMGSIAATEFEIQPDGKLKVVKLSKKEQADPAKKN